MSDPSFDWHQTGEPVKTISEHRADFLVIARAKLHMARAHYMRRDISSVRTVELLEDWAGCLAEV